MQAALTFWQQIVAGDSWGEVTIPVIEKAPETAIFFILLFLTIGMAVTNLILGVVVSVAQQARDQLQQEDQTEKTLIKLEKQTHLLNLCKEMDTRKTGMVSKKDAFQKYDEPGEFRDSIVHMEITKEDFDIIWTICDIDKKGAVSYKDFVNHIYAIRNSDTSFMLSYIKYYITLIRNTLVEKMDRQHELQMNIENRVAEEVHKIEAMDERLLGIHREVTQPEMTRRATPSELDQEIENCLKGEGESNNTVARVTTPTRRSQSLDNEQAYVHADTGTTSTRMNADTQIWLKRLCHDIGTLQVELKEVVADMNHKFTCSINEDFAIAKEPADRTVAPVGDSIGKLFPAFCRIAESSEAEVAEIAMDSILPTRANANRQPLYQSL